MLEKKPSLEQTLKLAIERHQSGQLQAAETLYQNILQSQPRHPAANHNLGVIKVQSTNAKRGLPYFQTALEAKPDSGQYWLSYADALAKAGDPYNARLLLKMGESMGLQGKAVTRLAQKLEQECHIEKSSQGQSDQKNTDRHKSRKKTTRNKRKTSPKQNRQNVPSQAAINSIVSHFNAGRLKEAEIEARNLTKRFPKHHFGWKAFGSILLEQNRNTEALAALEKAKDAKPDEFEIYNTLGNAFKGLGRMEEAMVAYTTALETKPNFAEAHNNRGLLLEETGNPEQALACFNRALIANPEFAEAHNNKGNTLQELDRTEEALASYERALELKPDYALAHNNKGYLLSSVDRWLNKAAASFYRALKIKPDYGTAYKNLIELYERTNQMDSLSEVLVLAKNAVPEHYCITYGEAVLLRHAGEYEKAKHCIQAIDLEKLPAKNKTKSLFLLAKLCDQSGHYHEAYHWFEKANQFQFKTNEKLLQKADKNRYLAYLDHMLQKYTKTWISAWRTLPNNSADKEPVFLVGFPRSGTTLLDTILRSHPETEVIEEKPAATKIITQLAKLPGDFLRNLSCLGENQRTHMQNTYFREMNKHLENPDKLIVDKLPLNLVHAGILHRIFPNAHFIFAQRHPCDCVLSCFMQNFELNDAMANFLDLSDAALFYDKVMRLWLRYCKLFDLPVHTVIYEDIIANFDGTITPLLEFLNLDWAPALRDYRTTALKRGKINTPSYNQVIQPLYTHAKNRWEKYKDHMKPVLPILLPWAERLGYTGQG